MTDTPFVFHCDHIRAAARCAGKSDPRHYLNGVLVEVGDSFVNYIGTDGKVLFACQHAVDGPVPAYLLEKRFILDREGLKAIAKADELEPTSLDGRILGGEVIRSGRTAGRTPVVLPLIDGSFPEWQRVLPEKVSGEQAQFRVDQLARADAAFADLGARFPHLHHNGEAAGVLTCPGAPHALAVVMPFRSDCTLERVTDARARLQRPLITPKKRKPKAPAETPAEVADGSDLA